MFGTKRTQLTQSLWPCLSSVNWHSPSVFHSLIVRSRPQDMIRRLSGLKHTDSTSFEWPDSVFSHMPVATFHRRTLWSQEAVRAY